MSEHKRMSREEVYECIKLVARYEDYEEKLTADLMCDAIMRLSAEVMELQLEKQARSDG